MTVFAFSTLALLVFVAVALLVRAPRPEGDLADPRPDYARGVLQGSSLALAARLFDSSDYHWLRDEVGFPRLARELERRRRRLALCWLDDLRRTFLEWVRTPDPQALSGDPPQRDWALLAATLRIHLLLAYAFFVVRFFGPYHRLVPSFGWLEALAPRRVEKPASPGLNLPS
jgi:hypothetical protein